MPRPRFALTVILAAQFIIPLSISGTAVALPGIASELGSSPGPLQWVVNGFNVAFALCTIVWGVASDRIGYTRSFRAGLSVAVFGSGISAFASDLVLLDVGRIVAGIGAAAVLTGAAPLLSHLFEGRKRTAAFALFGTVNGLGLAAGPALSGFLLTWLDWRGIFAVHALVLVLVLVLVLALIGSIRLPAIARGHAVSLRTLLDFSALRSPRFLAMALVPVAGAIGFVTYLTYLPAAFGAVHGFNSGKIGWLMLIMTVPVLVAPTVVGRLLGSSKVSSFGMVKVSLICLAVGGIGVVTLMRPELPVAVLLVPMLLLGLGFGLPLGFVDAEALSAVPTERAGAASGVINLFRVGSEAVFVALFAVVLTAVVTSRLPGEAGRAAAAGALGNAQAYYPGLVVAGLVMLGLVVAIGVAFSVLERVQVRAALCRSI